MKKLIKICPMCGSIDIRIFTWGQWLGSGMQSQYECFDCHFTSKFFPEVEEDKIKDFRERIKK